MVEENFKKQSLGVLIHSFFVIPFIIAIVSVLLIAGIKILTSDSKDIYSYLSDVKLGGASKRWQSAFELSKIFQNFKNIPQDKKFVEKMISIFEYAIHDDPRVRSYLAIAMGKSRNKVYIPPLLKALDQKKDESAVSLIYALGLLKAEESLPSLERIYGSGSAEERLTVVGACGAIPGGRSLQLLVKALKDREPNVTWEAALHLAKYKDMRAKKILSLMLTRSYWQKFKRVDDREKNHAIIMSIRSAVLLNDPELNQQIIDLGKTDTNIRVRGVAKTLLSDL